MTTEFSIVDLLIGAYVLRIGKLAASPTEKRRIYYEHCCRGREEDKDESARAAEEIYQSRGRYGRLRHDEGIQTGGRDDEPEFGLCRYAKAAIRTLARRSFGRSEEIRFEWPGADRRHLRSSSGPIRDRHFGNRAGARFDRNRRTVVLRFRRFDQQGAATDQTLRGAQNSARESVDQNSFDLG